MLDRDGGRGAVDEVWVVVDEALGLGLPAAGEVPGHRAEDEGALARAASKAREVAGEFDHRDPGVLLERVLAVGVTVDDEYLVGAPVTGSVATRLSDDASASVASSTRRVRGAPAARVRSRAPVGRSTIRAGRSM